MHDTLAHVDAPMYQFHHKKFSGSEGIKLSEQKHTNDYNIYPSLKGSKKQQFIYNNGHFNSAVPHRQ